LDADKCVVARGNNFGFSKPNGLEFVYFNSLQVITSTIFPENAPTNVGAFSSVHKGMSDLCSDHNFRFGLLTRISYNGFALFGHSSNIVMKTRFFLLIPFTFMFALQGFGQEKKPLSPEATVNGKIGDANVEIVYCRPSARGRKMLGGNEPYGEVWRTGANAATTFTIDKAVRIEGKELPAGKYELFTIPGEKEWVIIFQKFSKQWGAFSYKKENDVLRVTVPSSKTDSFVETFTIAVEKNRLSLKWENTFVAFKVEG
jgi:Protein of unknown function (DUF2911)